MDARSGSNATNVERTSDRELVVTRTFNAPARLVFDAWTKPDLFKLWWTPKSFNMTIISCEMDVRVGGGYHLVIAHPAFEKPMDFFGKYLEVTPPSRIVWTNEEAGEAGAVTTVTFEDRGAQTRVVLTDLYPTKEALDEAIQSGSAGGYPEQFEQLDRFLAA
jgi:uncharacterized protein YndB with AHSA1/START domain